jgi:hypothetical protein
VIREAVTILRRPHLADHWRRFDSESVLGEILTRQQKYAEAEPLLRSGYEGLKERVRATEPEPRSVSALRVARLARAGERLVELYDAWGRPDEAAAWRARVGPAP